MILLYSQKTNHVLCLRWALKQELAKEGSKLSWECCGREVRSPRAQGTMQEGKSTMEVFAGAALHVLNHQGCGEVIGNPLQFSCFGNPMEREEPGGLQSIGLQRHDLATKQQYPRHGERSRTE